MRDTNLALKASAAVTTATTGATVDFGGPDTRAIEYVVVCTAKSGTGPTLAVKIQESSDDSTWRDFLSYPSITAVGVYRVSGRSDVRYRRVTFTTGGTTPSFTVSVYPELGGQYTNF